jgi:mono/diheme cytochrome c family protein
MSDAVPARAPLFAASALVLLGALCLRPGAVAAQDDELPDGPGKKILQTACTSCHELKEVTKFKGYYAKGAWRDVVVTMVAYGAELNEKEIDVLVDYLTAALGKKSPPDDAR